MKLLVFISWIFIYVHCQEDAGRNAIGLFAIWPMLQEIAITIFNRADFVKQSEVASIRVRPERMKPNEAPRLVKRDGPKHSGWVWCSDKDENSTFALKPCPGDPQLEECLKVTNVSRRDVHKLLAGKWPKPRVSIKKWALCYLSKNGVMSSEGVLRQDAVLRNIPERDKASVEKTINKCLYKTAHDPVETAWHYLTCFRHKLPNYAKIANRI